MVGATVLLLVDTYTYAPVGDVLRSCLTDYQNPIPLDTLEFQIGLAVAETSDLEFVPQDFRTPRPAHGSAQ